MDMGVSISHNVPSNHYKSNRFTFNLMISWLPQNIFLEIPELSRKFQDIYSHISRTSVEKDQGHSRTNFGKWRNLKDFQRQSYKTIFINRINKTETFYSIQRIQKIKK